MKCPICKKNTYKYHSGFLGYESMRCSNCKFESSAGTPEKFALDIKQFKRKRRQKNDSIFK
jgi:hypothetical protein